MVRTSISMSTTLFRLQPLFMSTIGSLSRPGTKDTLLRHRRGTTRFVGHVVLKGYQAPGRFIVVSGGTARIRSLSREHRGPGTTIPEVVRSKTLLLFRLTHNSTGLLMTLNPVSSSRFTWAEAKP